MLTAERSEILSALPTLNAENFRQQTSRVLEYQLAHNPLYARFARLLGRERPDPDFPPFLPIGFFKSHRVQSGSWAPERIFTSSSTTGQTPAQHLAREVDLYLNNARRGFAQHWGRPEDWCVLALLPSYLEREGSSLVAMAEDFIRRSKYPESGFYLRDFDGLRAKLQNCREKKRPTLLLGVSFALLDFAEAYPEDLSGVHIMETGGMKGRREEITRADLHETLKKAFHVNQIYSEYGMTELFSQAYISPDSKGHFLPAPTMKVLTTEINDPFAPQENGKTGVLNVIDLANVDTCAFIATEDLGRVWSDGSFDVIGRLDSAELRGCNLMVE